MVAPDSAALGVKAVLGALPGLERTLEGPLGDCFTDLQQAAMDLFRTGTFEAGRRDLAGETSVLLAATRGDHLWWFSIGDIALYLLHSEYAELGQYGVNQRSFYEWVGRVHTFDEAAPSYLTGT